MVQSTCNEVTNFGRSLEKVVQHQWKKGALTSGRRQKKHVKRLGSPCPWWWWTPKQDSLPVEFCRSTSMHGLSFTTSPNVHLTERIFWTIAFILGVVAAVYLINDVWQNYYRNPVIVSFQVQGVDIDSIPFPSFTLCNMNAFPKAKVKQLQDTASGSGTNASKAAEALKYVRNICNAQQSFSKSFDMAFKRGVDEMEGSNDTISEDSQGEMIDFLMENTIPCKDVIRLCTFGERKVDCGEIFKPVITDYGKCCSFNVLPLPLLLRNPLTSKGKDGGENHDVNTSDPNPSLGRKEIWSQDELNFWKDWDFEEGFILKNKSQARPYHQKRAGMPYGLSILIDPNLHEWYCPTSDSEGFRFLLHNPLELPHMDEFASIIQPGLEILAEIHPEMTNADDDIKDFEPAIRHCYFPKEHKLQFFGPFTGSNCIDECEAMVLAKRCNCTHFFMPRNNDVNICNTDPESNDFKCIASAKSKMYNVLETLKKQCKHCASLCDDIVYHSEMTTAKLQNPLKLWNDPDPNVHTTGPPPWANNTMSIMHIFFASESVVPKLRKRLYGTTDLIANTGGLLGLCLGFSVLSAVEVIYFMTLRACCHFCRRRFRGRKLSPKWFRSTRPPKRMDSSSRTTGRTTSWNHYYGKPLLGRQPP